MPAVTITRAGSPAAIVPDLVMTFESGDQSGNIIHPIAGRPNPDVTLSEASLSVGTLRQFYLTYAAAEAARQFQRAAAAFTITAPDMPWLPSYFVVDGVIRRAQQDQNRQRWMLEVPFQEIAP